MSKQFFIFICALEPTRTNAHIHPIYENEAVLVKNLFLFSSVMMV